MRHTPPPAISLRCPTLDLGIPLNIQNIQTPPPTSSDSLFPFPSNPCTHTHLIVIDSVFVPLCRAVASDEDTYTEPRHCTHCTLCRNYRSATSCTVRAFRLGVRKQLCAWKVIAKCDRAECVGRMARLLWPYCRPHPLWTRTRGSRPDRLRGPAGEGGSGLRKMCLRLSIVFTPPQGWEPGHILSHGTKPGVCVRGLEVQGRGFDGEQAMTSLYPSTDHYLGP